MNMRYWILLSCMLLSSLVQAAQKDIAPLLEQLHSPIADSLKHVVSKQVEQQLVAYFSDDNLLQKTIDSLTYIGSVADADNTLRIVTWNYGLSDGSYGCHAIFIKKNGKKAPLIHAFSTTQTQLPAIHKKYNAKNWYGALYYRIIYYKKKYYLLGYTTYQTATRVKLIDVLTYQKNKPQLGEKVFEVNNKLQWRMVFEYSSYAQMLLHYDEVQKGFIFDHLSPEEPSMDGIRAFYGPDFSYDGLFYHNKKWVLRSDLDIKNLE